MAVRDITLRKVPVPFSPGWMGWPCPRLRAIWCVSPLATATYIVTAVLAMLFNYLGYHSPIVDVAIWTSLGITLVSAFHYIWHARLIIEAP